jgi:hypothetical protein
MSTATNRSFALAVLALAAGIAAAEPAPPLPSIRSNVAVITIQDGEVTKKNSWTLAPEADPDVYEADLIDGRPHRVTFTTDVESIGFDVEEGKQYDFVIRFGGKDCHTRIVGTRFTPPAVFDAAYRAAHRGKTFVEVPEVYELVNVAIAMTPTGIANHDLVYHDSEYYGRVRAWFDKFSGHPLLAALDSELSRNKDRYFPLKMNGYAFEFDGRDRIVQNPVYDRTAFSGERRNSLRPYLEMLQSFADASRFREFYRQSAATYEEQIRFFREVADVGEMRRWLDRNFPSSSGYGCYKILFSPLVAYNQSATWLESNGFQELQAHVNFPYTQDLKRSHAETLSPKAAVLFRGNIVFTELNHGYINPEADKYADRVLAAVSDWAYWVDESKGPSYYPQMAAFNEYMNWGLVSLRLLDYAPAEEVSGMIDRVDQMMVERRGFRRFREFDTFLTALYRARQPGQTVADLYPQIIEWFEKTHPPAENRSPAGDSRRLR